MSSVPFTFDPLGYSDDSYFDWCLGQTVQALVEDQAEELAAVLLACRLSWERSGYTQDGKGSFVHATIHGSMSVVRQIQKSEANFDEEMDESIWQPNSVKVEEVLNLVLGPKVQVVELTFQVEAIDLPLNWREELLEIARKKGTTNQGRVFSTQRNRIVEYANLRFRSASEIKIAQALDSKGILYFANCTARVNRGGDRVNREPDFLVCDSGRWGILEVDGDPFHTPSNVAQDHERDRLFEHHGIGFVQHYQATRCYQEPQQVVTEFLELLNKNG